MKRSLLWFCSNVLIIAVMTSCHKEVITNELGNFNQIFETFWTQMNLRYVYWDTDRTNWDSLRAVYKPKFAALTNSDADRKKSVSYFRQMSKTLIDGHLSIAFHKAPLIDSSINPSLARKSVLPAFHLPYNYLDGVKRYLDKGYISAKGTIASNYSLISIITGTINGNILYFNTSFFSLRSIFSTK